MNIQHVITGDEPVSLEELKIWCRVDYADDDLIIEAMGKAARSAIERYCGISIVEQTVTLKWDNYTPVLFVPYGPVRSYTTIKVDGEDIDAPTDRHLRAGAGKLEMVYLAGYEVVPEDLRVAIMQLTSIYYDRKDAVGVIPNNIKMLIEGYNMNLPI